MKLNDILELEIIDMTDEGNSIAKYENIAVFLDNGVIGDKVRAKITKIKKNYMQAEIIGYIEKSPIRNDEKLCTIQESCGGCQILDIKYEEQLKIKKNLIIEKLKRLGNIENPNVKDVVGMKIPFRYRNKVQMPLSYDNGQINVGFYKQKSHDIIPFDDCLIQDEINNEVVNIIKDYIKEENITIYNEKSHEGNLRHIITKISHDKKQIMLILVTKEKNKLNINYLEKEFKKQNINVKSIIQNINSKRTNVILSNENINLLGKGFIEDSIEDLVFRIYPNSFYQVNYTQMLNMYNKAIDYADLNGDETVFDLYCGIGTISLLFAKKVKKVYGIEVVEEAIKSAKENAINNKIENAQFICGKVEDKIEDLVKNCEKPQVIVLDPARKGCEETVLNSILQVKPEKIVYISCNPSTLARDLKILLSNNEYRLEELTPYDLFCHSMHVECVAFLKKSYCKI